MEGLSNAILSAGQFAWREEYNDHYSFHLLLNFALKGGTGQILMEPFEHLMPFLSFL